MDDKKIYVLELVEIRNVTIEHNGGTTVTAPGSIWKIFGDSKSIMKDGNLKKYFENFDDADFYITKSLANICEEFEGHPLNGTTTEFKMLSIDRFYKPSTERTYSTLVIQVSSKDRNLDLKDKHIEVFTYVWNVNEVELS